jgi:hypothetical protein
MKLIKILLLLSFSMLTLQKVYITIQNYSDPLTQIKAKAIFKHYTGTTETVPTSIIGDFTERVVDYKFYSTSKMPVKPCFTERFPCNYHNLGTEEDTKYSTIVIYINTKTDDFSYMGKIKHNIPDILKPWTEEKEAIDIRCIHSEAIRLYHKEDQFAMNFKTENLEAVEDPIILGTDKSFSMDDLEKTMHEKKPKPEKYTLPIHIKEAVSVEKQRFDKRNISTENDTTGNKDLYSKSIKNTEERKKQNNNIPSEEQKVSEKTKKLKQKKQKMTRLRRTERRN